MELASRIVSWLAVFILGVPVGASWLLSPATAAAPLGIQLDGPLAFNQVRGDIGGVFVGLAIVVALGLVRKQPRYLEAGVVALVCVIVGRSLSLVADGFAQDAVMSIVVEVVLVWGLWTNAKAMAQSPAA